MKTIEPFYYEQQQKNDIMNIKGTRQEAFHENICQNAKCCSIAGSPRIGTAQSHEGDCYTE